MHFNPEAFTEIEKNIFLLKRWNWQYLDVEAYQLECAEYVRLYPEKIFLIICNHPHCFTLGKGLQKTKKKSNFSLIDFDESQELNYPLFKLKRGGGLTFHYPGQLVLYPILNLTNQLINVHDLMTKILDLMALSLNELFNLKNLYVDQEVLGLWGIGEYGVKFKLASIGLAITRFNTYHGLALNVLDDKILLEHLKVLYPCGLPGKIYESVASITQNSLTQRDIEELGDLFILKMINYLREHKSQVMMERQISSLAMSSEISF